MDEARRRPQKLIEELRLLEAEFDQLVRIVADRDLRIAELEAELAHERNKLLGLG